MPLQGEAPGEVTLLISKQGETSTYSEVQKDESLTSFFILYPLHSLEKTL